MYYVMLVVNKFRDSVHSFFARISISCLGQLAGIHVSSTQDGSSSATEAISGVTSRHRFDVADAEGWLSHLWTEGFVVLSGVLTPSDCDYSEDLLWEFLEEATEGQWKRHDVYSWQDDDVFRKLGGRAPDIGLVNSRGAGQSELSWFLRERTKRVFATLWGTDDLITSFDGIGIFRPWRHVSTTGGVSVGFLKNRTRGGWLHVDQGRSTAGQMCCVQGLVSLYEQNARTGGFQVVPKSHLLHKEIVDEFADDQLVDYVEPPADRLSREDSGLEPPRLVVTQAGDVILWDSRTLHASTPGFVEEEDNAATLPEKGDVATSKLLRAVVYVCMTPKHFASPRILTQRRQAYDIKATTSHWPHKNVMGFGWARGKALKYADAPDVRKDLIC
mmetsp:Transcript_96485/g.251514  ORF Transcript_96485/g.251514 Transcript_96485/m.251514 type:complete len:387 (+) Transcript_96485:128-1288(+)